MAILLVLALLATVGGLVLLGLGGVRVGAAPDVRRRWLDGQVELPAGLDISPHAEKHQSETLDAWTLYDLFENGGCVASRRFCGAGGRELYLCEDPATGLIGGLVIVGDVVITGYGSHVRYWQKQIDDGRWVRCQ